MLINRIWIVMFGLGVCACEVSTEDAELAAPGSKVSGAWDEFEEDEAAGPLIFIKASALCLTAPDEAPPCGNGGKGYFCEGQDSDDDDETCPVYHCDGTTLTRCDGERHPTNGSCSYNGPFDEACEIL